MKNRRLLVRLIFAVATVNLVYIFFYGSFVDSNYDFYGFDTAFGIQLGLALAYVALKISDYGNSGR